MAETDLLKMASGGGEDDGENVPFNPANVEPCDFIFEHDDYDVPKPIEGLRDVGLPPFLRKTYEMVDDPSTDSIISWAPAKTSFVVWDPHRFSTELLPAHFKHRNFSSFVRQLNTYCFRKIDSDRWEFANYGFQHGKKHLLNCIKRQNPNSQVTRRHHVTIHEKGCLNNTGHGMEAQFEKLKNEHSVLQMEVLKLRQQHENTLLHLDSIKARLHTAETKQRRMALFLVKFLKNPVFLHYISEKVGKMRDGKLKKRRLANVEVEEARKATNSDEVANMSIIDDDNDGKTMVVSCDDPSSAWEQKKTGKNCPLVTYHSDASSENFFMWEKLMEEDMIYEDDEKEQSDMVMELEDLISSKPAECSVQIRGKVEPVGCLASMS